MMSCFLTQTTQTKYSTKIQLESQRLTRKQIKNKNYEMDRARLRFYWLWLFKLLYILFTIHSINQSEFHQLVIMLFHHSVVQFSLIFKLYLSIFLSLSSHYDQSPMFDY